MWPKYIKTFFNLFALLSTSNAHSVLSFSGGGSFGINQLAILDNLSTNNKLPYFEHYSGVSTGSLSSTFLSYYKNIDQGIKDMKDLYFNLKNSDIINYDIKDFFNKYAVVNNSNFKQLIYKTLTKLESMNPYPFHNSYVGTSNINAGTFEIFLLNNYDMDTKIKMLMASAAIPFVFPPIEINNNLYVDGGLLQNQEILFPERTYSPNILSNIMYISTHNAVNTTKHISSFKEYIKRLFDISFQIDIIHFPPYTNFTHCYPTSEKIEKYSILNFENSKELYDLTYNNFECRSFLI
jgi:NTE family protein